jgi:hypothetical protein
MRDTGQMRMQISSRARAEARAVLAKRTDRSSRFLDAALSNGPEFEPIGCLAGCGQKGVEDDSSTGESTSG